MVLLTNKRELEDANLSKKLAREADCDLTFGGEPVELRRMPTDSNDLLIRCKGVIGTYRQIKNWMSTGLGHFGGVKGTGTSSMSWSGDGGVAIDCLTSSKEELDTLDEVCQQMINN